MDCPDPERLQKGAIVGQLTPDAISCLERVCFADGPIPDRLIASRLLVAHYHATGEKTQWARVVQLTLGQLDPDNADLSYRYGLHLLQFGAPSEALSQAERAREHSYVWDGLPERGDRLYNLYSLRARAGLQMLQALPPDGPTMARRVVQTKARLLAVEWIAVAQASGRDTTEAVSVCVETGWEEMRCRDRAALLSLE